MTKIIAHRGYWKSHPQNTLAAFGAALERGADAIELDVHMSSDGELVVHHDYCLSDPGKSLLFEKDAAYIQSMHSGEEKTPLLSEVFDFLGSRMQYEIELKGFTPSFLASVTSLVRKYNLQNEVEFTSPVPYNLSWLQQHEPSFITGLFATPFPAWMSAELGQMLLINNALLGGVKVLHCPLEMIDTGLIAKAHAQGLLVHAADCNSEDSLRKAFALGVDQLSTDELELALSVLAGK